MATRLKYVLSMSVFFLLSMGVSSAIAQEIRIMTKNLYLGAELTPVVTAQTPDEFLAAAQAALAQATANNFPERAWALAAEIAEKKPHLVGLQEVVSFTLNGFNGPPPFRDYLEDLMAALAAQGADYTVVAAVRNADLMVPLGENLVGVTDRDVILARSDVASSVVPLSELCEKPSLDGCNYRVVASVDDSPIGTIVVERGFVAVDALIGNVPIPFVNTHLEERQPDPTNPNPLSPFIQAAQAFELISILSGFPNPSGAPVIVVGDINSAPGDQIITTGPYTIVPPYTQLAYAGYIDAWTLRPGDPPGLTCCQAANLLNPESILYERIDVTFISEGPVGKVKVNVTGNDEANKTPSGLWPSDHAGLVTRLEFAP